MGNELKIGQKQGHLTIAEYIGRVKNGHETFRCDCDCGNTVNLRRSHLTPDRQFCSHGCVLQGPKLAGMEFGRWVVLRKHQKEMLLV